MFQFWVEMERFGLVTGEILWFRLSGQVLLLLLKMEVRSISAP